MKFCDDCPDERVHRPYSKMRGKNYRPSVSDLVEMGDTAAGGMAFKAAEITARYCHRNADWRHMPEPDAVDKAKKVHKAMWKTDADLGTLAHAAAERFSVGEGWEISDVFADADEDVVLYDHDAARLEAFVDGIYGWFDSHDWPTALGSEFIVGRSDDWGRYFGTADNLFALGETTLVDWKTHREKKDDESKSFHKWSLQLNMLSLATHLCHFHGDTLVEEIPWHASGLPRPTRGLIVSIDHDGSFREYEIPIDPDVYMPLMQHTCGMRAWRGKATGMKQVRPANTTKKETAA